MASSIPWPPEDISVIGIVPTDTAAARKKKLRSSLLTFHPDKFSSVLARIEDDHDRATALAKVQRVAQRIIEEKEREGL